MKSKVFLVILGISAFFATAQKIDPIAEVQTIYKNCLSVSQRKHKKVIFTRELNDGKRGPWVLGPKLRDSGEILTVWIEGSKMTYATIEGGEDYYLADRWCFRKSGTTAFIYSSRGLTSGFTGESRLYYDANKKLIRKVQESTDPDGKKHNNLSFFFPPRIYLSAKELVNGLGIRLP
jgi:hypothetical protein